MENRDRDKMRQDQSKSDSSATFGQKIGQSESKLNEPSSRRSGSVGSSGMKGDSGRSSADLESASDISSSDKSVGSRH